MADNSPDSAQTKAKVSPDESGNSFILQETTVSEMGLSVQVTNEKQEIEDYKLGSVAEDQAGCVNHGTQGFGEVVIINGNQGYNKGLTDLCALSSEILGNNTIIESVSASEVENGCEKDAGNVGFAGLCGINGNKIDVREEFSGKNEKRPRKRGKGSKKGSKAKANGDATGAKKCVYERVGDGSQLLYPRRVLEALRYVNMDEQKRKWTEVYCGLGSEVAVEYDGLVCSGNGGKNYVNFDPREQFKKNKAAHDVHGGLSGNLDEKIENAANLDPACGVNVNDVDGYPAVEEDYNEDDDSDAEYASIQKPAFYVTGEPNFDSGPPQDGLEYLRRVRWEAEQIPKVKVVKVDRSKSNKEQTVYMPDIPDIAVCPEHLTPSKQWEDVFLADFVGLRLALSHEDSSNAKSSDKLQSLPLVHDEFSNQILETISQENPDNSTSDKIAASEPCDYSSQDCLSVDENGDAPSAPGPKFSASEVSGDWPSLHVILGMEPVARVSMLRKRIKSFETISTLSKCDCAWLFALCAAVDTPLDADTCASVRSLLRKCADLRAGKLELDDEVIMLNILATISGKYFGQSEN